MTACSDKSRESRGRLLSSAVAPLGHEDCAVYASDCLPTEGADGKPRRRMANHADVWSPERAS
jgi:hypothetical protein